MSRHDVLTPEERALAALLREDAAPAPPAAVDAAVLAAARDALAADAVRDAEAAAATPARVPTSRRTRRRPRWQPLVGLAASVAFAVGIAWQLQPTPAGRPVPPVQADASRAAETAALPPSDSPAPQPAQPQPDPPVRAQRPAASASAPAPVPAPAAAPAPAPAPASAAGAAPAARSERLPAAHVAAGQPPQRSATRPVDAPADTAAGARHAKAPAAMTAEIQQDAAAFDPPRVHSSSARSSSAMAPAAVRRSGEAAAEGIPVQRPAKPAPAQAQRALMRGTTDPVTHAAADLAGQVRDDARLPRRQWLLKIRHRNEAGDVDAARASLEAYLQAYPETRVPADLRALLDR